MTMVDVCQCLSSLLDCSSSRAKTQTLYWIYFAKDLHESVMHLRAGFTDIARSFIAWKSARLTCIPLSKSAKTSLSRRNTPIKQGNLVRILHVHT